MRKNFVPLAARLAALACLSSALSFAGNWSGILVDSRCWDIQENNRGGTLVYDGRDGNLEIRLCSPGAKTRFFSVVLADGSNLKLDAAGNAKAAELILDNGKKDNSKKENGKKAQATVVVTGETSKDAIKVDSISLARISSAR